LSYVIHHRCPWSFVVPPSFIICHPLGHLSLSSSYGPGAPAVHPTSSCLSAWGWVLCRLSLLSLSLLFIVQHCCPCSSSSSPSSSFVVRCCHPCHRHSSFVIVCPSIPIPRPPVGCSSSSVVHPLVPPVVHPTSSCS
jgi:hypothetical protein